MSNEELPSQKGSLLSSVAHATGIPNTLKGKAQRIFLRMLAGGMAHPYVKEIRQNLDDMDARSRINMIVAEEIGRQAISDPIFMERAKVRLLDDTFNKQKNLESVLSSANAKIEYTADDGNHSAQDQDSDPSQDWINSFTREAELASSEELRDRLAGILAGEIKNPGTFSRSTIRAVAEMDHETLQQFTKVLRNLFVDGILTEEKWSEGEMFSIGNNLESTNLITGSTGFIHKNFKFDHNGNSIMIISDDSLVMKGETGKEIQVPCWLLTKVGQQIAILLNQPSPVDQLKNLARLIDKTNINEMHLGKFIKDKELCTHDLQIWPTPSDQ